MNRTLTFLGSFTLLAALAFPAGLALAHEGNEGKAILSSGSAVEVVITPTGDVLVRGAKVTAISGGTITAATTWGGTSIPWSVVTDGATTFLNKVGAALSLSDIAIGDTISFVGSWNSGSALSVHAQAVKDWTKGTDQVTLKGTVESVNSSAMTFVLARDNATTTVQVNASTTITENGSSAVFADITVGDTVSIGGTWNTSHSIVTAAKLALTRKATSDERRFDRLLKQWLSNRNFFGFHFDR
ncbi:MAG: DUF5666 domain-containing protein [bacterium]|nr:DUF5666 domain-containing protein [bacterium]